MGLSFCLFEVPGFLSRVALVKYQLCSRTCPQGDSDINVQMDVAPGVDLSLILNEM